MSGSKAHDALFAPLAKFLSQNWGYHDQLWEPARRIRCKGEVPDCICWAQHFLDSLVVDVKVRRDDLNEHLTKEHVRYPSEGMGKYRYIAMPWELSADKPPMPDYWGKLIVLDDGSVHHVTPAHPWPVHARNWVDEADLLLRWRKAERHGRILGQDVQGQAKSKGKIPHQVWSEIDECIRNAGGSFGLHEAKRVVLERYSGIPKSKVMDVLRKEAEDNDLKVVVSGQAEYLELAEQESAA